MDLARRLRTFDRSAAMLVAMLVLGACAGSPSPTVTTSTSTTSTAAAASIATAASIGPSSSPQEPPPSPSPTAPVMSANPAPLELQGTWKATVDGHTVTLTIRPGAYVIQSPGEGGGGKLAVIGDSLRLFDGSICPASGTYRWKVAADELTLTVVGKDRCSGRADLFDDIPYHLELPPT